MLLKRYYSKKEFISIVIRIVLTILAFLLFAGNTNNPDYMNYSRNYYSGEISVQNGLLKSLLTWCFSKIGIPYQCFLGFVAIFVFILIWKVIIYYSDNKWLPFALYIIYPFLLDIVQIDNYMSYVIVLYGLRYLDDADYKIGNIKYLIIVMIATLIHPLSFIYLLFLLVRIKNEKKLTILVCVLAILLLLNVSVLPKLITYIPFMNQFSIQLGYYLRYTDGFKLGMILYAAMLIVCYIICRMKYRKFIYLKQNETKQDSLIKIMLVTLCFVPLIMISSEFVRVVRNLWILYYCFLASKNSGNKCFYYIASILISCFLSFKELGPSSYYFNSVTRMIFENNLFFS